MVFKPSIKLVKGMLWLIYHQMARVGTLSTGMVEPPQPSGLRR
eukprot:SAG11_NODE_11625_length_747_cov_5.567901_1_plen_42_part_01